MNSLGGGEGKEVRRGENEGGRKREREVGEEGVGGIVHRAASRTKRPTSVTVSRP